MAIRKMKVLNQRDTDTLEVGRKIAEKIVKASVAGDGDWIIIPAGANDVLLQLSFPGGGTGKVQYTMDPVGVIEEGNEEAIDWSAGVVGVTTFDVLFPVTAVRMVNATGTSKLDVRVQ